MHRDVVPMNLTLCHAASFQYSILVHWCLLLFPERHQSYCRIASYIFGFSTFILTLSPPLTRCNALEKSSALHPYHGTVSDQAASARPPHRLLPCVHVEFL